ncbi:lytic transglycosylase [Photobacterium aquimaris]|uniref:Lytic transglycosylase n=1 Tax=Photobacterium aquimaris TaxID=512643 RepID=A0A2T3IFA4_9GAMM|nr:MULTISPECIES: LysM peptidoglycan-binding domain-containing protein [Photobacterium]OBU12075.1 lytic transglycosylase [Photobacterium aquimaris]OBU19666.1 lytic transglycosylase [Photobacterium aquimaris]PSU24612.1 lytic transglycosylase [Photobacterium aquimaris]PSV97695.1 lytic transglycosylase [Photobacterium aquimaris]
MKFKILLASVLVIAGCQTTKETTQVDTNQSNTVVEQPTNTPVVPVAPVIKPPQAEVVKLTPQQQQDVWDRIAMQITTKIPNNKRVQYYRNWYLKNPRNLEIIAQRAQPFLYYITEQVEKRGMPLELALLPIVESSFDPHAYSSMAAAGLWQIIPDTGRRFGLKQNSWYDGRRDVVKSTTAALNLLEYLNKKFDGNWQQALAAYNTGEGRVFSAIRKNKAAGKPTDYWALDLPNETSSYVPKLYAVADIIMHSKKYGFHIAPISNKPVVAIVKPGVQMDLTIAAKFAGISLTELKDLNPAYRRGVTAPNGLNQLLLPINTVKRFKRELAQNRNASIVTHHHRVKAGESLGLIAKRYHSSVKTIQKVNKLKTTNIRIGQLLTIPTSPISLVNRQHRAALNVETQHYVVQSGDSLWSIARKHKTSITKLKQLNRLSKNTVLQKGQRLKVSAVASVKKTAASRKTISYKVRRGDSLSVIAQRYDVSIAEIKKWNNLANSKYIKQGQQLKLIISSKAKA